MMRDQVKLTGDNSITTEPLLKKAESKANSVMEGNHAAG
jgi:hypothetical protein